MPPRLGDLFDQCDRLREEGHDLIEQSRGNRAASAAARKMRAREPDVPLVVTPVDERAQVLWKVDIASQWTP